ncbi:unnamed protein product [Rotaria sordida]|uniref:OTU domain-containing protein n=1 Tax=Rotaria sordida TaxID=392033 RepID=A0A815KSX3_9BILA|nr:unnamed protein product [Rotaria sordida]
MSRDQKFSRLLQHLEKCSQSIMYYDEIAATVQRIRQIDSIMVPYEFRPNQIFDERKHIIDAVAKQYLEQATSDVHHLVPVKVTPNGNCLYYSILVLMNNPAVTTSELRVRTIIELITNETYYSNTYSPFVGPIDIAIQTVCKDHTFSELYEIAALCNVLKCNIRTVYPQIDVGNYTAMANNIFHPCPPIVANCEIKILWSHTLSEKEARIVNNSTWSPNHFVPLLSPSVQREFDTNNQSASILVTPEKQTFKNNSVIQIRIPEFQLTPSRRLRSEINIDTLSCQSIIPDEMLKDQNNKEEQRQIRLEKKRERVRSNLMNETEEQRRNRLEKDRERTRSRRMNETDEQHQNRLEKDRHRIHSSQMNDIEEQRQNRLEKKREQTRSSRMNETEEQRQNRLEQQRKRSQANREKKKIEKRASHNISTQQQNIQMRFTETEEHESYNNSGTSDLIPNENIIMKNRNPTSSSWPEPISRDLKENCLKEFLHQMSMSSLAETTCAVCNSRTSVQKSKSVPLSKITVIESLKVSDETKALIMNTQLSNLHYINHDTVTTVNSDAIQMIDDAQSNIHLFVIEDFFDNF